VSGNPCPEGQHPYSWPKPAIAAFRGVFRRASLGIPMNGCQTGPLGPKIELSMELLLNVIWFAIAAGLLFAWHSRWLPEIRGSRERSRQSFVGLVCVLALLFPAISLSDDLHPAVVALSDTKSIYAVAHGHDSPAPGSRSHSVPHVLAGPVRPLQLRATPNAGEILVGWAPPILLKDPLHGPISGRAPPLLS
jgi:hypothetical protein